MREPRNPFRMRTSEHIESELTFLRLFGSDVLSLLPTEGLWERVQLFQSAPGGGKTSLFRLFTPLVLRTLHEARNADHSRDLYRRLVGLGAMSEDGPQVLGVMLSCARNYASLEDLGYDGGRSDRMLYTLLNARIILATLRSALALKGLRYPDDLPRLSVCAPDKPNASSRLPLPSSGADLYKWAESVERTVCAVLDSFSLPVQPVLSGDDGLDALLVMRPDCILCDGLPIAKQVVLMLDDAHRLASRQRNLLLRTLFDTRPVSAVWIAERLEALPATELLAVGATTGREYGEPIILEEFWRFSSKRFENAVTEIAEKRTRLARETEISSFAGSLQDTLEMSRWGAQFENAIADIRQRVSKKAASTQRYADWIRATESSPGSPSERALAWQKLEIQIERDLGKMQLAFEFALSEEELVDRSGPDVAAAAEYILACSYRIPYYFGMARLATLGSANIEQFLALAGDLFEELISAALIRTKTVQPMLSAEKQQALLQRAAQQRWEELPRRIPNGRDVQRLLEAIGDLARTESLRPSASYAPGVTGIAITMADREKLLDSGRSVGRPEYDRFGAVLSACIAQNLLEPSLDRKQGQKGKTWMLLYLNRWLCIHFGLPLQYGGWRPRKLEELVSWLSQDRLLSGSRVGAGTDTSVDPQAE